MKQADKRALVMLALAFLLWLLISWSTHFLIHIKEKNLPKRESKKSRMDAEQQHRLDTQKSAERLRRLSEMEAHKKLRRIQTKVIPAQLRRALVELNERRVRRAKLRRLNGQVAA